MNPSRIPLAPAPAPRAHPALAATAQIAIGIAPKPSEVRRVRNEVAAALAAWRIPRATDLVLLVVSELVTNAIRHAPCSEIQVSATYGDGVLLVEVRDGSGRPPTPVTDPDDSDEENGRGLRIVHNLTSDWGWTPLPDGTKNVWALLPIRTAAGEPT